jgi:hypothetical protein
LLLLLGGNWVHTLCNSIWALLFPCLYQSYIHHHAVLSLFHLSIPIIHASPCRLIICNIHRCTVALLHARTHAHTHTHTHTHIHTHTHTRSCRCTAQIHSHTWPIGTYSLHTHTHTHTHTHKSVYLEQICKSIPICCHIHTCKITRNCLFIRYIPYTLQDNLVKVSTHFCSCTAQTMYTCTSTHTHTHTCLQLHNTGLHWSTDTHMYTSTHTGTHAHTHRHTHTHTHTQAHTQAHTHKHTFTYAHQAHAHANTHAHRGIHAHTHTYMKTDRHTCAHHHHSHTHLVQLVKRTQLLLAFGSLSPEPVKLPRHLSSISSACTA